MPVFTLSDEILFPPVELANESGVLAVGGDLSPERLFEAYTHGIFPWFSDGDPIIWWAPDPRFVLFPNEIKISKSMKQVLNRNIFKITCDQDFEFVIRECRKPRKNQDGTWITDDMLEAYVQLHNIGLAHSVEAWQDGEIVGGLYGISIGSCFFGESMFARVSNASKAAFIAITRKLRELNFTLIDCQVHTDHLKSLGAREIPREEFMELLAEGFMNDTYMGSWGEMIGDRLSEKL
ncbi:MAG: leucyl/phenylalanyl-tRNA--protein transferase [bacterium]|nr:leucyl/phenylalanyl-tRNA--protein transferase [bacterium]